MGLLSSLVSAKPVPFKLPQLVTGSFNVPPQYNWTKPAYTIPALPSTPLISEHGQGGGYTPGSTGAAPSTQEAQNGYNTNPDYDALLKGDTILSSGLSGLGLGYGGELTGTGQAAALQSALANSRKAAIETYGGVPSLSQNALATAGFNPSDIDDTTRQLAASNPNSILAQLTRQYNQANEGATANLAARGMLSSGALGQHLNENLYGYNQGNYDSAQQLLNYFSGLWSNYQGGLGNLQTQRGDLINSALGRIISQINANQLAAKAAAPTTPPSGGGAHFTDPRPPAPQDSNPYQGWANPDDILASLATEGVSAYSPDYVGSNYIPPQKITPTNFYTDVSLGAQSQTAAAVPRYSNAYNNPNLVANLH